MKRRRPPVVVELSAFSGFRFPPSVIMLAVRWYLRFNLSYRDVEELLAERGVEVDHVSIYRWVQRFMPLLIDAARPCRHSVGDRWHVDETYVKVSGEWRYVYRAVDQFGQVIDVYVSPRRDAGAARRFFAKAIKATATEPSEVVTDGAKAYPGVLDALLPGAFHNTVKHANNSVENDHGRLKPGCGPCEVWNRTGPPGSSFRATPSYRTCDAVITSSVSRHHEPPTGGRLRRARHGYLSGYRERAQGLSSARHQTMQRCLVFQHQRSGKAPSALDWDDLDAGVICAFLDHLETDRHNSPRTRNVCLTAIRSLFGYASSTAVPGGVGEPAWVSRRLHTLEARMEHDSEERFTEAVPAGAEGAGDPHGPRPAAR